MRPMSPVLCCALLSIAVAACVEDGADPELGDAVDELSVSQWPDDEAIPDKRSGGVVALTPWNGELHMVYTDPSSTYALELWWARWDGTRWSPSLATGRFTGGRPALATFDGRLIMVYQSTADRRIMMTSTTSQTWSTPVEAGRSLAIGGYTARGTSLLAYGGKLYLTYCADNGSSKYVNVDRFDGTSWTAYRQIPVSYRSDVWCEGATMVAMPDTGGVEILWSTRGSGSTGQVFRQRGTIGRSASVWYSTEALPMKSAGPVSVVTCNGATHLVHRGWSTATELWWSYRDGGDWVPDTRIPNQWSDSGATLGCLAGTYPLMVHNVSGGTQLMQSLFAP